MVLSFIVTIPESLTTEVPFPEIMLSLIVVVPSKFSTPPLFPEIVLLLITTRPKLLDTPSPPPVMVTWFKERSPELLTAKIVKFGAPPSGSIVDPFPSMVISLLINNGPLASV